MIEVANLDTFVLDELINRSVYYNQNYKFQKIEPTKVEFQIELSLKKGKVWKSIPFEVNIEKVGSKLIYLDEQKQIYIIC